MPKPRMPAWGLRLSLPVPCLHIDTDFPKGGFQDGIGAASHCRPTWMQTSPRRQWLRLHLWPASQARAPDHK